MFMYLSMGLAILLDIVSISAAALNPLCSALLSFEMVLYALVG